MEHALTAGADYCWNFQHESSVTQNSPKWRRAKATVELTHHATPHYHTSAERHDSELLDSFTAGNATVRFFI